MKWIIITLLLLPLVYAETGTISIYDNEIEIVTADKSTTFECNNTEGTFQFALPNCDRTDYLACNSERKFDKQRIAEQDAEILRCTARMKEMESNKCPDNSMIISDNAKLKEQNRWLKYAIIANVIFMVAVFLLIYMANQDEQQSN